MRVGLHPEARGEFRAAALWYEERRDRLGDEFVAAIAVMLQRIGEAPESFPRWPGTRQAWPAIRKATIERFPYLIAFEPLGVIEKPRGCSGNVMPLHIPFGRGSRTGAPSRARGRII